MKKILLLLAAVGMIFTACEPANGLDEDNNGNNTEQPGGGNNEDNLSSIECARNEIIYKTKYGYPITLYSESGFGAKLMSNTYEKWYWPFNF